jgi:dTMP kinase
MGHYKGKLISIDGIDGSGKSVQTKLLVERLKVTGFKVETVDFPRYGKKSAGLVEKYLNGKYGSAEKVGPYRASLFYAIDRYDASFKIKKWLAQGRIVVSNRYTGSNLGHQGGKIKNALARKAFFDWLYKLEYGLLAIPKPDLNIFLHVPAEIAQTLVDRKRGRAYIGGRKRDIHEDDLEHLKNAEKIYLEIARAYPDFELINCTIDGEMLKPGETADQVWKKVKNILSLPMDDEPSKPLRLVVERLACSAKLPAPARADSGGFDLFSSDFYALSPGERLAVSTGIKILIPPGYVGLLRSKNDIAKQGIHTIVGVIESSFTGELIITLINLSDKIFQITMGQAIAQLLVQKIESPSIIEGKISV